MDSRVRDDQVPMNDDFTPPATVNAGSYAGEDACMDSYETHDDPSPQGYVQDQYQQQQQQPAMSNVNPAAYYNQLRPPPHEPLQGNQPYPPPTLQQPYSPHHASIPVGSPYNRLPQQQHLNQPYPPQRYTPNSPRQQPYPPPSPQQQQQQVSQYPPMSPVASWGQAVTSWSTDLFACLDDINLCLLTNFAPCIAFGWIAEIVDQGTTSYATSARRYAIAMVAVPGTQFIYSGAYRTRMRQQYGIAGDGIEDVCTHIWCEGCALYQEYKELTARGYDVPLGWQGNLAKQKQEQQMAPPVSPNGMLR